MLDLFHMKYSQILPSYASGTLPYNKINEKIHYLLALIYQVRE